ncbi:MAG: response regulator [bacterium]|nr:response regulator [bacterium]
MTPKILIVDDEAHIRRLIERALEDVEDQGVTLITAEDGQTALDLIVRERPALVFLDVMLPKLDGFEVCARVRQEYGLHDVVIVILTAKGQDYDRQRGEAAGANHYMTKPFDPDVLVQWVNDILKL